MLDALPPPAFYEEAPLWAKTPSGILLPTKKAILPGMTPYPGLIGGSAGGAAVQVPPWPTVPTTYTALLNVSTTSGTATPSGAFTPAVNSALLCWVTTRTQYPDANPQTIAVTDSQGGTWTRVGVETRFSNNSGNAYVAQLWKRDQLIASAVSTTVSVTTTTVALGLWNTALIFELKNPGGYPFHCEDRSVQSASSGSSFTMPNSGDLFCMDFCAGGGATSTISATSGFTKIYEAATFVSSNLRHTILTSALQTQAAGRTYSYTTFQSVTSAAIWFEGPKRSKPTLTLQYCGKYQASANPSSFSITGANIGTPAVDRMVHVLLMQVYTVALSPSMSSSTPTPTILPWMIQTTTSGQRAPNLIYSALVPTGTTMDFTFTSNQIGYWVVYIWASYGQARIGANLVGSILGDPQVPRNVQVANGGSLTAASVVVPKGAILFGGAHAYSGAVGIAGDWTADDTNPVSGGGAGFGARLDNSAGGADLTGKTLSMTMGGSNNAGLVGLCIGP